ncbi:MAG: SDR family NAD(P)-dependent oxidoreductase [Asticcacaulis sp.]|nr:SDR family NAD(P)-dependent oxidoreductase [Asticcacaulis sp.]
MFGYGFIGKAFADLARASGHTIIATARDPEKRAALEAAGMTAVDPNNLADIISQVSALLITPAPGDDGCPAFAAIERHLRPTSGKWIGYLSTTGVYGDRDGNWVWEDSALIPSSAEGRRRLLAESQWRHLSDHSVSVFRLPGLYGPGRNVIERLKDGTARRIHKPGHVFSRLHHDDCASALLAALEQRATDSFNLCDDCPAPADEVLLHATKLTGLTPPPAIAWDDPSLSPATRRFYADNKRVSNARAKAVLGWKLKYPTYVEGLAAILEGLS